MIRTTAVPRPLRVGAAVVGVAGAIALAGCSATDSTSSADTGSNDSGSGTTTGSGSYTDGTYTAQGAYTTPESVETISVTVTLENDVITDVEVTGNPKARESKEYQSKFIGGIADVVVGQDIDAISVSRVAGSSLTSGGFNDAIEQIKVEAAA
ncbi:FMN-binding protein [Microbacterium sp. AZCO]|uniref:FMN-binding protein n=1 Tax=Microbacterium sp. AZCO TaxID=3142976 RepID=UPI0031F36F22